MQPWSCIHAPWGDFRQRIRRMWFGRSSHKWASGQPTLCDSLYEIRKVLEFTGHSLLITKADLEVAISDTEIVDHPLCGCFILQGYGIGKLE